MKKATPDQIAYITDLVLKKFGIFREFKKWLATTGIVRTNGQIFKQSMNLVQIGNRITQLQASEIITLMESMQDLQYKDAYDQEQIDEVNRLTDEITQEVQAWTFADQ